MKEKSIQILIMIKCQKLVLIVVVYLINSVFNMGKNCYPQVLFEEYKYIVKRKKLLGILLTT